MLKFIGGLCEREGNPGQAEIVKGLLEIRGGRDIPFPGQKQILILEDAVREYRRDINDPELLTRLMRSFLANIDCVVPEFLLKTVDIRERRKAGDMAIFVPSSVNKVDLGRMFPEMDSWAVRESNSIVDGNNNSGWLWIELTTDAPYRNTTERQLEGMFRKKGRQGHSLETYIWGSQVSKLLTDRYFDEGPTWSRLLGSRHVGRVLHAYFDSDGRLHVASHLYPGLCGERLGGRSEEVVKA